MLPHARLADTHGMGIIAWLLFGLVAGLVARFLMPGAQKMSWIMTSLLGIGGAFVGGFLGGLIRKGTADFTPEPTGFVGAVLGAIVLLWIGGKLRKE